MGGGTISTTGLGVIGCAETEPPPTTFAAAIPAVPSTNERRVRRREGSSTNDSFLHHVQRGFRQNVVCHPRSTCTYLNLSITLRVSRSAGWFSLIRYRFPQIGKNSVTFLRIWMHSSCKVTSMAAWYRWQTPFACCRLRLLGGDMHIPYDAMSAAS